MSRLIVFAVAEPDRLPSTSALTLRSPDVAASTEPPPMSIVALLKLVTSEMPMIPSADVPVLCPALVVSPVSAPLVLTLTFECALRVRLPLAVRCAPVSVRPVLALASSPALDRDVHIARCGEGDGRFRVAGSGLIERELVAGFRPEREVMCAR